MNDELTMATSNPRSASYDASVSHFFLTETWWCKETCAFEPHSNAMRCFNTEYTTGDAQIRSPDGPVLFCVEFRSGAFRGGCRRPDVAAWDVIASFPSCSGPMLLPLLTSLLLRVPCVSLQTGQLSCSLSLCANAVLQGELGVHRAGSGMAGLMDVLQSVRVAHPGALRCCCRHPGRHIGSVCQRLCLQVSW